MEARMHVAAQRAILRLSSVRECAMQCNSIAGDKCLANDASVPIKLHATPDASTRGTLKVAPCEGRIARSEHRIVPLFSEIFRKESPYPHPDAETSDFQSGTFFPAEARLDRRLGRVYLCDVW